MTDERIADILICADYLASTGVASDECLSQIIRECLAEIEAQREQLEAAFKRHLDAYREATIG